MDPIIIKRALNHSSPCFNFIRFPPLLLSSSSSSFCYPINNTTTTTCFKKPTNISVSSNNQNPPTNNTNTNIWLKKFSFLFKSFFKTTTTTPAPAIINHDYLQNGGGLLSMALLSSVTSTAKVRISPFVATLAANPTFVSGFFAWLTAQSLKVLLHFCFEKKLDLRIMSSSGGMPSSHSALCTALTTSVAICHGVADSLFPVSLGFTLIVMYDAIGVRRHAGMQAQVLNLIVEDLFQGHPISKRKLKELLGHTPSQVFAGAVLGILVACFCCRPYCFAAT